MLVFNRFFHLGIIIMCCCSSPQLVQADDDIVGVIWQLGIKEKSGKVKPGPTFRATPDKKVWNTPRSGLPKVVGTWSGDEENTKMVVDGLKSPKTIQFNGKYEFVLIVKSPSKLWQGTFKPEGSDIEVPILVRLIKD